MNRTFLTTLLTTSFVLTTACQQSGNSNLDEAWNIRNDPRQMGWDFMKSEYSYTNNLEELPMSGSLEKDPWSGDYWPTYKGGITYRWNSGDPVNDRYAYDIISAQKDIQGVDVATLSPAEKYDLYLGAWDMPLTNYERQRTQVMKTVTGSNTFDPGFTIPQWEGLCHAWAPATIMYDAPKAVTLNSRDGIAIPFGASDIKALLTYNVHSTQKQNRTYFLGRRCNLNVEDLGDQLDRGDIDPEEYRLQYRERLSVTECADTNAGAFHITLANQIGLKNEGFIVDITRDAEVWNQAVSGFDTTIIDELQGARPNAAEGTVRSLLVQTAMTYINEIEHSFSGNLGERDRPHVEMYYLYWLELDEKNEIIGGEWAQPKDYFEVGFDASEYLDRPDFLWKVDDIGFTGVFEGLKDIYEASIKGP